MPASERLLLLRQVDAVKSLQITGLGFFPLDKSLIVSYLASVLTFAALIAGLVVRSD